MPFFDRAQIARAVENEAIPALDRLAQGSALSSHLERRFDQDDPPPYESSTEDDWDNVLPLGEHPIFPDVTEDLAAQLNEPLDEDQHEQAVQLAAKSYSPGPRFEMEVHREQMGIKNWAKRQYWSSREAMDWYKFRFFAPEGSDKDWKLKTERVNIIARRNVRRRWQKLGVWNSAWGIPGRLDKPQSEDDTKTWIWPWQRRDSICTLQQDPVHHPVARAAQLRRGRRREEHAASVPRSHIKKHTSATQAESFLISRPWFLFKLEAYEECVRRRRLSTSMRGSYEGTPELNIKALWKQRQEWQESWGSYAGWKWRHESPSPEPEDLSRLDDLATSCVYNDTLGDLAALDFTPSEVDAMESIVPSTPPPTPPRVLRTKGLIPKSSLFGPLPSDLSPESSIFGPWPTDVRHEASPPPITQKQPISPSPVARRRGGRPRQMIPEASTQTVRRSARIAAIKAKADEKAQLPNTDSKRMATRQRRLDIVRAQRSVEPPRRRSSRLIATATETTSRTTRRRKAR